MAEILIAQESFASNRQVIQRGRTIRAGHPLTRGREHLFKPFVPDFEHEAPAEKPKAEKPEKVDKPKAEKQERREEQRVKKSSSEASPPSTV